MGKRKRKNPSRLPATQADVERARTDGVNRAITMMLWVLVNNHNATQEELDVFANELNYLAESIGMGYVKLRDIEETLQKEYKWESHIAEKSKNIPVN